MVAEIGVDEAYAPLRYVRVTLGIVFALLVLTAGWAAWSTLTLARLRQAGAGRRIGAYRLERELAEGGMATVHLARHALLKRPRRSRYSSAISHRRSLRPLRARSSPRERTAPSRIRSRSTTTGTREGSSTTRWSTSTASRSKHDRPRARAAAGAHAPYRGAGVRGAGGSARKGMIHRDIKPENVMVCERGGEYDFVKLLDFGIVKRIEVAPEAHPDEAARSPARCGCSARPPTCRRNASESRRAWTRGPTYTAWARSSSSSSPGGRRSRQRRGRDAPAGAGRSGPAAGGSRAGVPAPLDDLVARCLAKAPVERPGAVGDIVTVLASFTCRHGHATTRATGGSCGAKPRAPAMKVRRAG